jgi:two-component system LytT family sensor kinase
LSRAALKLYNPNPCLYYLNTKRSENIGVCNALAGWYRKIGCWDKYLKLLQRLALLLRLMKSKEVSYHIIGWIVYVLYIVVGFLIESRPFSNQLFTGSFTVVKFLEFYFFYLWVYPRFLKKNKVPQLIGGILLGIVLFIIVRYTLEEVILFRIFHIHNYFGYTALSYIVDNMYYGTSALVLSLAVYSSFNALRKEQENKSLREEKVKAELAFLKSQINPHFLYNTLNYIYSLAYPVSDHLADAIIKLSQLMRYMLTESSNGEVDLQKEIDYIENYIAIYQLRFGDHFNVEFVTQGNVGGQRIASLMLIPFVENAFKHGVVDDPNRPVRIVLKLTGNRMEFTVSNKINHQQKDHSSGVGLVNIRRRLELIYPGRHDLLVSANGQTYKSTLQITL